MKAERCCALAVVLWLGGVAGAQSGESGRSSQDSGREKLIGAWRLVSMEEPGADGKLHHITDRKGMLIYTSDGHMFVQLMFPAEESTVSNDYVRNGYEASFGSYEVDEKRQTVTHHVEGSITRGLVGKDMPRVYEFSGGEFSGGEFSGGAFSGGHLILKSARADEHWSVTWEHY